MEALEQVVSAAAGLPEVANYAEEYRKQHQMLVLENFLSSQSVAQLFLSEVAQVEQYINRVKIPGFKKSGSVSYHHLKQHAPHLFSLYKSDNFRRFIAKIVGEEIQLCPEIDPHAAALYYYTEVGDHIKVHYDKSFYKGRRYTVLLGMIQDSEQSKLICYPGATKRNMRQNPRVVTTHPGTLVVFNGDSLWHEVSPLGEGEKRVILTMEFLTDTRISVVNKLVSDFKDRYLYFGKTKQTETL